MSLLAARRLQVRLCCNKVNVLSVLNALFCGWHIRDRFGILNKHSELDWSAAKDELPEVGSETIIMTDLMDEKATEILQTYPEGDIVVSWSGGVDSTSVVCALLKNGLPFNRLHVICATSSLDEYPFFYRYLTENNVRVTVTESLVQTLRNADCAVIVNGWGADQLFGSNIHTRNLELYHKPWNDALKVALDNVNIPIKDRSYDYLVDVLDDYGKQLGFEINEWCEFAWLYNFGLKLSYIVQEQRLALAGSKNQEKVIAFFDSPKFQQFAIQHFDTLKIRNVYKQNRFYKRELKQYIYSYTNDSDYFNRKGKQNSWAMVGEDLNQVAVLTDDGIRMWRVKNETNGDHFSELSKYVYKLYTKEQ